MMSLRLPLQLRSGAGKKGKMAEAMVESLPVAGDNGEERKDEEAPEGSDDSEEEEPEQEEL